MKRLLLNAERKTTVFFVPLIKVLLVVCFLLASSNTFGQAVSIWNNPITGTNPGVSNPYTTGDVKNANITVSGIGRAGVTNIAANNVYNTDTWGTAATINTGKYYSFTLTPATGYKISLSSFVYTGTREAGSGSNAGPTSFAFRSNANVDNFATNIGTPASNGATISLTASAYQDLNTATGFRYFAWNAGSNGEYSINDFTFSGSVLGSATTALSFGSANTYGSAPVQNFQVNGNGLTTANATVTINGSTNYEVSTTSSSSGFGATATLTASGGSLSNANVWVRLKSTSAVGTYNQNITFGGGGVTGITIACSGTVTTAPLTITGVAANNKIYDGLTTATLSGTAAYVGLQNGESFSVTGTPSASFATASVGNTIAVTVTGYTAPSSNYTVSQPIGLTANITTRSLTITVNNGSKTYGQTFTVGSGATTFTSSGLQNSESIGSITIASTGAIATAAIGTYDIVGSAATGGTFTVSNYSITYTNGTLTVNTAPLTITANNDVKVYGSTQATPISGSTSFGSTGLQNGETVGTVTLTYGSGALVATAAVGSTSTITASAAIGGTFTASNYTISYTSNSGTLTVMAAPLTITADDASKCFGTTYTLGATAFTDSGLQNGETIGSVTLTSSGASSGAASGSYSIVPSAAAGGTFTDSNYSISYVNGALTVRPAFTTGAISTTGETICTGGTPATTVGSATAASGGDNTITYSWRSAADTYTTDISGATAATYLPPAGLTATTSYRRYAKDNTCNTTPTVATGTWTVTVNQPLGAPTSASSSLSTICNGGSSKLTLNGGGGGGATVAWYTSSCGGTLAGTGNGLVVSPTSTTTYYGRYEGICNTTTCSSVTITVGTANTTWNGATWSNGEPDASTAAIIAGTYTSGTPNPSNLTACKLNVTSSATVLIKSGDSVALNGALTVDAGCFVTLNNCANLIQSGTTNSNSGAIVIKRDSSPLKRLDYTLWSSPVANQQLQAFSPNTLSTRFYSYNTSASLYQAVDPTTTSFAPLNGYLIRMPNTHPATTPTIWTGQFVGVPNNGTYSMALQNYAEGYRYNLVGNPYPSAIDIDTFIQTNIDNGSITGTVYFWRKTNGVTTNGAYCTYNLGGYVGSGDAGITSMPVNPATNTNVVQVGQGFFVEGTGSGSVVFTNDMRINTSVNRFFRTTNIVERNRIWLNITNATGSFSQAMIGYMTGATQGVDPSIDGKLLSDGDISLASIIETTSYTIQGRALSFEASDVVPMSFKVSTEGDYTITIDHLDGLFSNGAQTVYLRDNTTGIVHDLTAGSYTFTSASGTFATRFEIVYQAALGVTTTTFSESQVIIYKTSTNEISINTGNIVMSRVKIFDITGRLLQEQNGINATQTLMNAGLSAEILLVQVTSQEGSRITKKVVR